ncbi:hypothetical protein HUF15_43995 [Streptomyces samsunensis]|uniref:Uncharacterized protein n=2 Tax=Streptomyces malaysiensis TaxID=92644 RepID=A0A2J7YRH7_STRMQ|nr:MULTISPECIES: hypothetical protein [Streptomyces]AUA08976.1 hypothetical protein CFP59_01064 [Streptomyces sp. M56]MCC4316937.1 hypothetical protein [Streptomyces malaysiensis]MCD9588246.1 hypothetical protein [Streptomyces sp. 8ZJF_21]MCM3809540.1 hypothetical protein [Streptomyces sp. DR7-3]MCQ6250634.1 hypothetical protein [Streptomyces malaysiensis]
MSGTARPGDPDREPADPPPAEPEGGDPACWLDRVCADCGAIQDTAGFTHCARCGAPRE